MRFVTHVLPGLFPRAVDLQSPRYFLVVLSLSARLAWGNSGENMATSSHERRWWTEEEDNILRQEGELQRAFRQSDHCMGFSIVESSFPLLS